MGPIARARLRPRLGVIALSSLLALAGCARGGDGDDGGPQRSDAADTAEVRDTPPSLPVRSTHSGVASGHVSSSARYRLVLSTTGSGASSSPSSSRYVLREHSIGRMAEP